MSKTDLAFGLAVAVAVAWSAPNAVRVADAALHLVSNVTDNGLSCYTADDADPWSYHSAAHAACAVRYGIIAVEHGAGNVLDSAQATIDGAAPFVWGW